MMSDGVKIALVLVGAAAVGGVAYVATRPATPPAPPPPTPTPTPAPTPAPVPVPIAPSPSLTWTAATTVNPGDHVRVSMASSDLQTVMTSLGVAGAPSVAAWTQVLGNPTIQAVLAAPTMSIWGPDANGAMQPTPLPADWPADDTAAASEFHADFVYGGTAALSVSSLPVPLTAWVGK